MLNKNIACPCGSCVNKGCGSYHDECELFAKWKQQNEETKYKAEIWYAYAVEKDLDYMKGRRRKRKAVRK